MADIGEVSERSLEISNAEDLQRFIANDPGARGDFANRILCVVLCQGAALHQLDKINGVKDIDVYTFFASNGEKDFPRRPVMSYDFGPSKFGRHPSDLEYTGRRVDCSGRSIAYTVGMSPIEALRRYLQTTPTPTARFLAKKAVVVVDPIEHRGEMVWP